MYWLERECTKGHWWLQLLPNNEADVTDNCTCGETIIIERKLKPGRLAMISIIPAEREIDSLTGKLGNTKDFYFCIEDMRTQNKVISHQSFNIDEILNLTKRFTGLTFDQAVKTWGLRKLGKLEAQRS